MLKADEAMIRWLLEESTISGYRISKDTGIAQATISDLTTGKANIHKMRLDTAAALTAYAEKEMKKMEKTIGVYVDENGKEYQTHEEVYPSDDGTKAHVVAKDGFGRKYLLTFDVIDAEYEDHATWCDWTPVNAEYIGEVDAKITKRTQDLLYLDNGDKVLDDSWNGECWADNDKVYTPVYNFKERGNTATIAGVIIEF